MPDLAELRFLQAVLQRNRIQALRLDLEAPLDPRIDLGLSQLLGYGSEYQRHTLRELMPDLRAATIYKQTDPFGCSHVLLMLPETADANILMIGPYLTAEPDRRRIWELAEQMNIPPQQAPLLERYYGSMPLVRDESQFLMMMDAFGECLWGARQYSVVDVQKEFSVLLPLTNTSASAAEADNTDWNLAMLEARYAYEKELMETVSHGLTHKADMLLRTAASAFEQRTADPLRNAKNYCIILNTLARKAAESGGVHPVYLDSMSSTFAKKIEAIRSVSEVQELMLQLFRSYCNLVKRHKTNQYSKPVRNAIIMIDSDLTADLTLRTLAAQQNISASYLSALFKKETGQTITAHVNEKRMKQAMHLLRTTKLQIQTVAQHCGILDVQYFSKQFKKHTGKTPKEFRASVKV